MATIHIKEIQQLLASKGQKDAMPYSDREGYFLELRFDDPHNSPEHYDPEYANKVITVDSAYGLVTIQFDEKGLLKSIDLS